MNVWQKNRKIFLNNSIYIQDIVLMNQISEAVNYLTKQLSLLQQKNPQALYERMAEEQKDLFK